jgi:methionyl-tRNA formyltransferase
MDAGTDTGPILAQLHTAIGGEETGGQLAERLSRLGAELLIEKLPRYCGGEMVPVPQDERSVTYARMLKKGDGELDFERPAYELARLVRAYDPWPGTFFEWEGRRVVVVQAHAESDGGEDSGRVVARGSLPAVVTPDGLLVIDSVRPSGRKAMGGDEFLRGARGLVGQRLNPSRSAAVSEGEP